MPKRPGNIDKSKRIQTVRDVINKWGVLEKASIDLHVANKLGVPTEEISRALYRDLEELVRNNEVKVEQYSRDGILIDDFDPDVHKNFYSKWKSINTANNVLGGWIFSKSGLTLQQSERLKGSFIIESGCVGVKPNYLQLFFTWKQEFISVTIPRDVMPVKILIVRFKEESKIDLETIEKKLGKRVIVLSFPDPEISSFKDDRLGHLLLEFNETRQMKIEDLGSKNGSVVIKVQSEEILTTIKSAGQYGQSTVSEHWFNKKLSQASDIVLKSKSINIESPAIIKLSTQLGVLVV